MPTSIDGDLTTLSTEHTLTVIDALERITSFTFALECVAKEHNQCVHTDFTAYVLHEQIRQECETIREHVRAGQPAKGDRKVSEDHTGE